MNIKGKFVTLRAIEESDLELLREMINDPEVENLVVGWSFPVSSFQQMEWFRTISCDSNNLRFVIETEKDGAVGLATLGPIDWKNKSAFHGIKLARLEHRSKGIGTDSVMALMRYAFDELGLHRIEGEWIKENTASKRLYTKCGWKEEGTKRESVFKGGQFRDLTITGILASDYYKLIDELGYWK